MNEDKQRQEEAFKKFYESLEALQEAIDSIERIEVVPK